MRTSLLLHVLIFVKGLASPTHPDSRGQFQIHWYLLTRFLTLPYQPSTVDIHNYGRYRSLLYKRTIGKSYATNIWTTAAIIAYAL
jgi:hypothetical protein